MRIKSNARSANDVTTPLDLMRVFARRVWAAGIPYRVEATGEPDFPTLYLRNTERDEVRAGIIWRLTRAEVLG